jgi:hypothetical protein
LNDTYAAVALAVGVAVAGDRAMIGSISHWHAAMGIEGVGVQEQVVETKTEDREN